MNCTCRVFIAVSLDGYIARPDGNLDWLEHYPPPTPGEDYGYAEFMRHAEALVMGRKTFEFVAGLGRWPYGEKMCLVLTRSKLTLPAHVPPHVLPTSDAPDKIVMALTAQGIQNVYVDGGQTIQSFLALGLIREMTITRIPRIIGQGIPLFGPTSRDVELEHVETRAYPNGLVRSRYLVLNAGA